MVATNFIPCLLHPNSFCVLAKTIDTKLPAHDFKLKTRLGQDVLFPSSLAQFAIFRLKFDLGGEVIVRERGRWRSVVWMKGRWVATG